MQSDPAAALLHGAPPVDVVELAAAAGWTAARCADELLRRAARERLLSPAYLLRVARELARREERESGRGSDGLASCFEVMSELGAAAAASASASASAPELEGADPTDAGAMLLGSTTLTLHFELLAADAEARSSAVRVRVLDPFSGEASARGDTLGLRLWEAELVLTEALLGEAGGVSARRRRVVELGAGTGLAGLAAAVVCGAARVTLTDKLPLALRNLEWAAAAAARRAPTACPIHVRALDWEHGAQLRAACACDLVLAADCIYDPHDVPGFAEAVVAAAREGATVLMAQSVRNRATYAALLAALREKGGRADVDVDADVREREAAPVRRVFHSRLCHMLVRDWRDSEVRLLVVRRRKP